MNEINEMLDLMAAMIPEANELIRYQRSDENRARCEPYAAECQRLAELAAAYGDQCRFLQDKLEKEVVREEHAIGGEVMHRGYYCPSPVQDIVIGNCNRGKLLKRMTVRSKPTYKYGFNADSELIIAYTISEVGIVPEIIIRQDQTEIGIKFLENFGIQEISESIYRNGKIVSYIHAPYQPCLNSSYGSDVTQFIREDYTYSAKGLQTADFYDFLNVNVPILTHWQYHFQHNDEGFLSSYTIAEYEKDTCKQPVWDGHVYDISIKRKV